MIGEAKAASRLGGMIKSWGSDNNFRFPVVDVVLCGGRDATGRYAVNTSPLGYDNPDAYRTSYFDQLAAFFGFDSLFNWSYGVVWFGDPLNFFSSQATAPDYPDGPDTGPIVLGMTEDPATAATFATQAQAIPGRYGGAVIGATTSGLVADGLDGLNAVDQAVNTLPFRTNARKVIMVVSKVVQKSIERRATTLFAVQQWHDYAMLASNRAALPGQINRPFTSAGPLPLQSESAIVTELTDNDFRYAGSILGWNDSAIFPNFARSYASIGDSMGSTPNGVPLSKNLPPWPYSNPAPANETISMSHMIRDVLVYIDTPYNPTALLTEVVFPAP